MRSRKIWGMTKIIFMVYDYRDKEGGRDTGDYNGVDIIRVLPMREGYLGFHLVVRRYWLTRPWQWPLYLVGKRPHIKRSVSVGTEPSNSLHLSLDFESNKIKMKHIHFDWLLHLLIAAPPFERKTNYTQMRKMSARAITHYRRSFEETCAVELYEEH